MAVPGQTFNCFKPDDYDVIHHVQLNFLHCFLPHPARVDVRDLWRRRKQTPLVAPCCVHVQLCLLSVQLKAFALSPSGERLENPTTIEIVVLDQNDNRPVFTQSQFVGTVSEFSIPGAHCCFQFYTFEHE